MSTPHRVVLAGGGVAGLEALIALHHLAGSRVAVTLVDPETAFCVRALSARTPFSGAPPRAYSLERACADHAAAYRRDALHAVRREQHAAVLRSGDDLPFDSLLVAIGARPSPVYREALTFRGPEDADAVGALIKDVDGGAVRRIAFVVPPVTTWPLPLYELALLTAAWAEERDIPLALTIVTPEHAPLAVFGPQASRHVETLLAERGVGLQTRVSPAAVEHGAVRSGSGVTLVRADRVVALPRMNGPRVRGLPADADGFLPVDEHGVVPGAHELLGAGDGTTNPVKQGGIAAQQALAAATTIARRAGVDVAPHPFRPVLRGQLLDGSAPTYLRSRLSGRHTQTSATADQPLWWPPTKVAAPHLTRYLQAIDGSAGDPAELATDAASGGVTDARP